MSKKVPNGVGSYRKLVKNGKTYWQYRFTDPTTHKQRSVNATTEAGVRLKAREIQSQLHNGQYIAPQKQTVGAYLDDWIKNRINLEESTRELYERNIRLYIKPILGSIRLQELRYSHCQEMVRKLTHNPKREKQLSAKSVGNAAGILSKALADAVKAEIITNNPAANLDLPRKEKTPPKVMESAEQVDFLAAIRKTPHERVFLFGLYTGARISEVLGLQWKNINMKTGEIRIDKQLNRKKGDVLTRELKGTKTHKGRSIIVPRYVLDILKAQDIQQKEWRLKAGQLWQNDDGLVFTREDGSPMPHNTIANSFKRIVTRLGHPDLSFHSLRHTYITDEIRSGTDVKTVSEMAGHSTIAVTMDVYAAATNEMKQAAADRRQEAHEKANA